MMSSTKKPGSYFTVEQRLNYQSFANHYEVVQNVESYICFYNYKRIHSSAIGYMILAQKTAELEKVA